MDSLIEDNKDNLSEFDKLCQKIASEKQAILVSMKALANKFKNPQYIGPAMHEFFNYRIFLCSLKDDYRKILNSYSKTRAGLNEDMINSIRTGTRIGSYKGSINSFPKNADERSVIFTNGLSDIDYEIEYVNSHSNFIIDKISTIDKMTYNFDILFKFYEKYGV